VSQIRSQDWEQVHDIVRDFVEEYISWEAERKLHADVVVDTHPESLLSPRLVQI